MIVVKLKGGLGNQFFQYAAAKSLAKANQTEVFIDPETGFIRDPYNRSFELLNFCIDSKFISFSKFDSFLYQNSILNTLRNRFTCISEIGKINYLKESFYHFDERIKNYRTNKDIYLEGYFQSEKYFKDIANDIRSEFELKDSPNKINRHYLNLIRGSNSVSIHLRKYDDAIDNSAPRIYDSCTNVYYEKAISCIIDHVKEPYFFIFSDNIEWAKKNISLYNLKVEYISHNISNAHEDIRLMKACKHNIIANSSFSWWGAWLNDNPHKIVIAPKNWLSSEIYDFKDVIPINWLKL